MITKVASNTVREDSGMFRLDYRFTDTTTAYARYNIDDAYIDSPSDALGVPQRDPAPALERRS